MTEHTHDDHTHEEPPVLGEEGYWPPAEMQVEMLRQENERLNRINLDLRMQGSFQVQIIEQLKAQVVSLTGEVLEDQAATTTLVPGDEEES